MSGWINEPIAIIENDQRVIERLTYVIQSAITSYRRNIDYVTTRYVGCNYNAAIAKRDALLLQYAASQNQAMEASVQAAEGGQYHVIATLKTIGAWTLET